MLPTATNQQRSASMPDSDRAIIKQHQARPEPQAMESEPTFRFMDLPPEIRVHIYTILFTSPGAIQIVSSFMGRKRAIQKSLSDLDTRHNEELRCQDSNGKRFGQPPSAVVLAQVSKQLETETLPLIYGLNTFEFGHIDDLEIFLKCIGSAIQHLKHISVTGCLTDYYHTELRVRAPFERLAAATALRSLTLSHRLVVDECTEPCAARPQDIVRGLCSFVHARREAQKQQKGGLVSVFDVVKVVAGVPCRPCSQGKKLFCTEALTLWARGPESQRDSGPLCGSKRVDEYAQQMSQKIRSAIATELGVGAGGSSEIEADPW